MPTRVAPSKEERRSPQCTVPVSPQCPQEFGLPTLPHTVLQGAAISSERTSQFFPARRRSGAEMLATPSGVSKAASSAVPCRYAITGQRTCRSDYTRGQSRETSSLSSQLGSMETTAKCVWMSPAHCRVRLQNPVQRNTLQSGYSKERRVWGVNTR